MRVKVCRFHGFLVRASRARGTGMPPGAWGSCLNNERGATVVIVTLALAALTGMVVLVVDVGGLLTLRRRMVTAADAASLAAAQSCAMEQAGSASGQADELATANQADASRNSFELENCGGSASGRVKLAYSAPKTLTFAPILGAPKTRPVSAKATSIWGPAGGVTPVPIELSIDPNGMVDCAYMDLDTECAYWHDNSSPPDFSDSSNWGFMNLNLSDVDPDASCPNAGTNERRGWITGDTRQLVAIVGEAGLTYVCADSGHSSSSWYEALIDSIGQIKYFPINDPAQMILTSGKEKYAIIGFIPLQVDDVLRGNDPAAVGTPGGSGNCSTTHSFTPGQVFDLDSIGCYGAADSITNLEISLRGNVYREGSDYTFDPVGHEITWFTAAAPNARVRFDWAANGLAGKCGNRRPDPNGVCLVLSWQGVRVAGSLPGNGADFGLRAVRLEE